MSLKPDAHPVHVVHFIAGLQASGAEIALTRLVQASEGAGLRHTVVSLTDGGDLTEAIETAGGVVIALRLRSGLEGVVGAAKAIAKLADLRPDIVQGWMVHGNLFAWAVRTVLHRPARLAWNLRMSLKNAVHESRRTLAVTRAAGLLSRSVDLLISNSRSGLEDHRAIGYRPRRAVVIPNGFDPEIFRPRAADRERVRNGWALPEGAVVFGLVGRYHPVKGHDTFIRAASIVVEERPGAVFVLLGRGTSSDNAELGQLLAGRGLLEHFRLLGSRHDVPTVLCGLDVLCVPSVYEGFPNALGEAMASGVPCIATDVSDIRDILSGAGGLVEVGDHEALAREMIKMHDLGVVGRESLGRAARENILRQYTLEAVAGRYCTQYRDLVTPPAKNTQAR